MFKKHPENLSDILRSVIRQQGLETPLLQKRIIDAWDDVAGPVVAQYTQGKVIRNQTLWVKLNNPALRGDMQMMASALTQKLNQNVGAHIITDIRFH